MKKLILTLSLVGSLYAIDNCYYFVEQGIKYMKEAKKHLWTGGIYYQLAAKNYFELYKICNMRIIEIYEKEYKTK